MNTSSKNSLTAFLQKYIAYCLLFLEGDKEKYLLNGLIEVLGTDSVSYLSEVSGKSEDYILQQINQIKG